MSDQETLTYRLQRLETEVRERHELLNREIKEISRTLMQVRDKVLGTPLCPSPGTCLKLDIDLRKHEERIAALEKWQNKLIGIGLVALAASSILGPKISSLVFK